MDLIRPEPPALMPGVIASPQPWYRRLWNLAVRYRWEALPYYAAGAHWTATEAYAYLGHPGATENGAFAFTCVLSGAGAAISTKKGWGKASIILSGFSTGMAWTCWQTISPSPFAGALILVPAATVCGIPYWRLIGKKREEQIKRNHEIGQRDHEIEMAKIGVIQAYAASGRIPRQPGAPEIETVAEPAGRVPGQMPVVPWPGAPDGLSITDPIALSPNTSITLPGGHIVVGGGTDMGKSGILHCICCNIVVRRNAELWCVDLKHGGVELGIYAHAGARVATTPKQALRLLQDVDAEAKRRGDVLGATVHDDGAITLATSWTPTPEMPQIVFVIDELAELTDEVSEAADLLRSHTRLLRALGFTFVFGSQELSKRTGGGDTAIRGQASKKICCRVFEPGQTNQIMGQGAHGAGIRPDLLKAPGEFVILTKDHDGLTPDRAYYMSNQAIADHVRKYATGQTTMPQETEPEAFAAPAPEKPGRIDNATELITGYLRQHGWSTAEDVTKGLGYYPEKLKSFQNLMRRHADNGLYKRDKEGTKYAVNDRKTLSGNVVRFPGRRNA